MGYNTKEKYNAYTRMYRRRLREDWLKLNGPCLCCGSNHQLEVHHVDPTQKISHRVWTWSKARREIELAKCIVLCKYCHLRITREMNEPLHGTDSRYHSPRFRCRCDLCKEAHRTANKDYEKRKREEQDLVRHKVSGMQ